MVRRPPLIYNWNKNRFLLDLRLHDLIFPVQFMARSFRSRRFRRSARRYGARRRRGSSLKRIKRDIQKCNFPTKVKFMGLTERKVMFLTKNEVLVFGGAQNETHSMYLSPMNTDNLTSIMGAPVPVVDAAGQAAGNARIANWDKFCILGIYIKIQPIANMFNGAGGQQSITPVQCIYSMNNVDTTFMRDFDKNAVAKKQVFTFNSNEAFTIYVPAPTTMEDSNAVVHRSKTWWSLDDLAAILNYFQNGRDGAEEGADAEEENDGELGDEDNVPGWGNVLTNAGSHMHAGRLAFVSSGQAAFNITINYKVALKG